MEYYYMLLKNDCAKCNVLPMTTPSDIFNDEDI